MSTIKTALTALPLAAQPLPQRRPSTLRLEKRSDSSAGPDVTTTSPAISPSLPSVHPLKPPSLFQPPPLVVAPVETGPTIDFTSESHVPPEPSDLSPPCTPSGPTLKVKENTGRWLAEEHEVFLKGLNEHGKQWKKIAVMIKTRSVVQVRTHAQKYFQKLHKNEKKTDGGPGKTPSISTSTAVSTSTSSAVKRKPTTCKGTKTIAGATAVPKKRRVSLEPKPKRQGLPLMACAPSLPVDSMDVSHSGDHSMIDPSFMHSLHLAEGELADSLLDLLDDSSVEAVEHVIASDDMDLEPNVVENPNPVSPSVSSMSLVDSSGALIDPPANEVTTNRYDVVSSPNPEDFSIHNTIGTSSISGRELSPTGVTCVMDINDFEQKTSGYVDALDWLMDVGVHQLPATEGEDEWNSAAATTATVVSSHSRSVPQLSGHKLADVTSSALAVTGGDTF